MASPPGLTSQSTHLAKRLPKTRHFSWKILFGRKSRRRPRKLISYSSLPGVIFTPKCALHIIPLWFFSSSGWEREKHRKDSSWHWRLPGPRCKWHHATSQVKKPPQQNILKWLIIDSCSLFLVQSATCYAWCVMLNINIKHPVWLDRMDRNVCLRSLYFNFHTRHLFLGPAFFH